MRPTHRNSLGEASDVLSLASHAPPDRILAVRAACVGRPRPGDMVSRTAGTLTATASEAVRTLLELLKSTASAAVRLGAARAVLEIGMKVREMADLEERLAALEKAVG